MCKQSPGLRKRDAVVDVVVKEVDLRTDIRLQGSLKYWKEKLTLCEFSDSRSGFPWMLWFTSTKNR